MSSTRITCLALALVLGACAAPPAGPPATATTVTTAATAADWPAHLQRFVADYFAANPSFAVQQGLHDYDGRLPDWSSAGIRAQVGRLQDWRARTERFDDGALTTAQRFEKQYLLARIDGDLFWLDTAQAPFRNPTWYVGNGLDPSVYIARPYASEEVRLKAFVGYARAIPGAAAQIRANLRTPLPRSIDQTAIRAFEGFAAFYRDDVPKAYAKVTDAALLAQLKDAIGPAADAMQGLADWLKADLPQATDDYALGTTTFAAMLHATERVDTPLAELMAIGEKDLQRNLAALKAACAEILPGKPVADCVARVAADKPKGGAVDGARAQLDELRGFIVQHQLVTIPSDERALVDEAPPYQRANFAYIDVPGPYDKGMPSVYYISPPDPSWPPADQAAYVPGRARLLFTSVHEVWPGHFLQFLHANRSPSTFGQLFVGYAFAEGWAHYTEEMMWDAGLGGGLADVHVGQLVSALLRDVRYLCAIGLHTQGMSVETCERMFREQAYVDPGNARQQAARGTYDPAYLNYTLGKLMIRKLRDDWTASRGGRAAWREFHDRFLSYGGPPIPLVREQMLGTREGLF